MAAEPRELPIIGPEDAKPLVAKSSSGGWGKLLRWRTSPPKAPEAPQEAPQEDDLFSGLEGVVTDYRLVQHFFKQKGQDVVPIATDRFLNKSRSEYNVPWLTREIVQNFVDHNREDPGTLNGVDFTEEDMKGGKRFTIKGNWPFDDPTGIMSPHSDKPADYNTAGGNGIGLKQTAIRFLRDFGVQRFEIQGNGWKINYRLSRAADINKEWAAKTDQCPRFKVQHDWLVAEVSQIPPSDTNAYVIETDNQEVIDVLKQFREIGVSKENPYLQDMDFENEHGAIKWLQPQAGEIPKGKLYINGQVMHFKDKGKTNADYWGGTEFTSIRLNNIQYQMSIDRPPVRPSELWTYTRDLMYSMKKEDLVEQLQKAEPIWSTRFGTLNQYMSDIDAAYVLFDKMLSTLSYSGYDRSEYETYFPNRNYLCLDTKLSEEEQNGLREKGYFLVPGGFEKLGMPRASTQVERKKEKITIEKPDAAMSEIETERLAKRYGISVGYEDFGGLQLPQEFPAFLRSKLAEYRAQIDILPEHENTVRISMEALTKMDADLQIHPLFRAKTPEQKLLYFLRGVAQYGLDKKIFDEIYAVNGNSATSFEVSYDSTSEQNNLISKTTESREGNECYVDITFHKEYYDLFTNAPESQQSTGGQNATGDAHHGETPHPIGLGEIQEGGHMGEVIGPPDVKGTLPEDTGQKREGTLQKPIERLLTPPPQSISPEKEALKRKLGQIPVEQPKGPGILRRGQVIKKDVSISPEEQARIDKLAQVIPGLKDAVKQLDSLTKDAQSTGDKVPIAVDEYVKWRSSDQFYGKLGENAGYLTGRHLAEILNEQNMAEISVVDTSRGALSQEGRELQDLKKTIEKLANRVGPKGDEVDEFEMVLNPSEQQLAQLALLRTYTNLTTGVLVPNDLFIYTGTGSKGLNIAQKAIGMHSSLFKVQFSEAMRTFTHEIAHNMSMDHDSLFMHTMEALFATTINRFTEISRKPESERTDEERVIVHIGEDWIRLQAA